MGWYGVLYINFPPPPVFYFDFLGQVLVWHGNLQTHILDFFVAVTGQKGNRERANINGPLPHPNILKINRERTFLQEVKEYKRAEGGTHPAFAGARVTKGAHPPTYLPSYPPTYLPTYPPPYPPPTYLPTHLTTHPPTHLPTHTPTYPPVQHIDSCIQNMNSFIWCTMSYMQSIN